MAERKKNTFQRLKKGQLNRKERRDLERRLNTEDPGLEIVNRKALPRKYASSLVDCRGGNNGHLDSQALQSAD